MKKNIFITLLICLLFSSVASADAYTRLFEQKFATAVLLSKEETLSLGFVNYEIKNLGMTDQSLAYRNSLAIFSIPYNYKFHESDHDDRLHFLLSYVSQDQNFQFNDGYKKYGIDKFYNLYGGYSRSWRLREGWKFDAEGGSIAMHYDNKYSMPPSITFMNNLDGTRYNLKAGSVLLKGRVAFMYADLHYWGKWTFKSNYEYFYGWTVSGADALRDVTPHAWQIANTIKLELNIHRSRFHAESLFFKMQRVDIDGDVVNSFGTENYYEVGSGVLLNTKKMTSLIDNLGIGVNVNIGSSLRGVSLVFYFNEI